MHHSLLKFYPFLPFGWNIPEVLQNLLEKWQLAASRFSKQFCVNPRNALPIGRGERTLLSSKELCKYKIFWY